VSTDKLEVIGINDIGTVITPAQNSVDTDKIQDDAVTIAANTAKVTNATHTGDVTGATALTIATDAVDIAMLSATGTASATTFLRGDNAWASAGSSAIVVVHMSTSQTFAKDVWEKIDFDTEVFDTNGEYNTTNKRFTPTTAGYYLFSMSLVKDDQESQVNNICTGVYKNGSLYKSQKIIGNYPYYQQEHFLPIFQTIVYCNGSSDYLEPWFSWGANGTLELDVYTDSRTTAKTELTIVKVD
jgi:hypothetical protein